MASKGNEKEKVQVVVPKTAADVQRLKLDKLMKNAAEGKTINISDRPDEKLPRVFNPPEFIRNIWGSSAGAGSGDFHVYRGIRRREYARQKFLAEKSKIDEADVAYEEKVVKNQIEAEERTAKKRKKRQKKKVQQKIKKFKKRTEKKKESSSGSESEDDEENEEEQGEEAENGDQHEEGKQEKRDSEDK